MLHTLQSEYVLLISSDPIVHCTDSLVFVLLYLFCILTLHSSAVDITGRILGVLSGGAAQSGDPGYRHTQRQ